MGAKGLRLCPLWHTHWHPSCVQNTILASPACPRCWVRQRQRRRPKMVSVLPRRRHAARSTARPRSLPTMRSEGLNLVPTGAWWSARRAMESAAGRNMLVR